ncbi:hypothetical protein [Oerskovia jenensis]|uniref:hypothetical protein n=1 Tax=Oerskovia jenensis TaxID=162169 RepID=UPI0036DA7F4E
MFDGAAHRCVDREPGGKRVRDIGSSTAREWTARTLLAASVTACLVTGCSASPAPEPTSSPPSAGPAETLDTYTAVRDDIVAALTSLDPATPWETNGLPNLSQDGSTCTLVMANSGSQQYLYTKGDDFSGVRATLDPVLERHGFTTLSPTTFVAGSQEMSSTDAIGAELVISSSQYSVVRMNAPVLSPTCDSTELVLP